MIVDVLIPALNEAEALPLVLRSIPRREVRDVYVIDNGSSDETARVAVEGGAFLLQEPRRGYGAACLRGLKHLQGLPRPPDVVVFLDGDFSDDPQEIGWLTEPIRARTAELVVGSRALGEKEPGALTLHQRVANRIGVSLLRVVYGQKYTDLGRFRAIRFPALVALGMTDLGHGWDVEMQVKAARARLRIVEVPVSYRRRAGGSSKISQTLRGRVGSSYKLLYTILRHSTTR